MAVNTSLGCFQVATELIEMIFENIDNIYVMLGLTHDILWLSDGGIYNHF